jgi:hypothetical protein
MARRRQSKKEQEEREKKMVVKETRSEMMRGRVPQLSEDYA